MRVFAFINPVFVSLAVAIPVHAARLGYPPEEFATRCKALCESLQHGSVLIFGNTMPALATRNQQDNFEYEVEAEAAFHHIRNGVQRAGYGYGGS